MSVLGVIAGIAGALGNPDAVLFGMDHTGERCGVGRLAHLPRIFYPQIGSDLAAQLKTLRSEPWQVDLYGALLWVELLRHPILSCADFERQPCPRFSMFVVCFMGTTVLALFFES
eukprot:376414-Pleurochrysis_carterae.AAC.1